MCVCVWCCPRHWKCWGVQRGYFWISDSVSMAADASQRKALRYQQTLVGLSQIYLIYLSAVLSVSSNVFSFPLISCPSTCFSLSPSTHLSLCLFQPSFTVPHSLFLILSPPTFQYVFHNYLLVICFQPPHPCPPAVLSSPPPRFSLLLEFISAALKHIHSLRWFHTAHAVEHLVKALNGKSSLQFYYLF